MNERTEICQACLSDKRQLFPLRKLAGILSDLGDWVLNGANGDVCWECRSLILKFHKFKQRTSKARDILSHAVEAGSLQSLSTMGTTTKIAFDHTYSMMFDTSEGYSNQGIPITVKQEMIDQYAANNEPFNIAIGSPRTENGSDVETNIDHRSAEPQRSLPLGTVTSEQPILTENESRYPNPMCRIPEPVESMETISQEIATVLLSHIKTESSDEPQHSQEPQVNPLSELFPEEVQVKDEPLSDSEMQSDIFSNLGKPHNEDTQNSSYESTFDAVVGCSNSLRVEELRQQKQWERSIMLVYKSLSEHKYSWSFMHPISDKLAPKYNKIVKRPMNFGLIKKKIKAGLIRTTAEFHRDLMLMLVNALVYNHSDDKWNKMAKELIKEVTSQVEMLKSAQLHAATLTNDPPQKSKKKHTFMKSTVRTRSNTIHMERAKIKTPPKQLRNKTVKTESCFLVPVVPQKISKLRKTKTNSCAVVRTKVEQKSLADSDSGSRRKSKFKSTVSKTNKAKPIAPKIERNLSVVLEPLPKSYTVQQASSPTLDLNAIEVDKPKPKITNPTLIEEPQFTKADLSVAVTTVPQRDLTKDLANEIKKALEKNILLLAMDHKTTFAPTFRERPVIADGVIKLWCENEFSLKWLRDAVRCLKPPWPDVRLDVIRQCDLPQKIKSALLVPDCNVGIDVIHRLLRIQNPWAELGSWALYSAEKKGEDMFLVLGIPSTVIPILMKRERRLNFSLGSLVISFFKGGKLTDVPPGIE